MFFFVFHFTNRNGEKHSMKYVKDIAEKRKVNFPKHTLSIVFSKWLTNKRCLTGFESAQSLRSGFVEGSVQ